MIDEFGVQKNKALVHDLERTGHGLVVIVEFVEDISGPSLRQLDQQALGRLNIVCSNEQVRVVRRDLHNVVALSQLTAFLIKYDSILVKRLRLLDNGSLALKRFLRVQRVILTEAELVAMCNTL